MSTNMAALCVALNVLIKPSSRRFPYVLFDNKNNLISRISTEATESKLTPVEDEFRQLQLRKKVEPRKPRSKLKINILPPRYTKMPTDQTWPDVWPTAHSFKPSVVPFPVRQGYSKKGAPPDKFGNLELMKIPNFLHLTPPAIQKHCEAIKKFCTPWPRELNSDEMCEKYFPVEVISSDYCHSGPDLHDPRARIVSLKVKLSKLRLGERAKDKLLRLVGAYYDQKTDYITITTERCPLKKQNYDYAHYILTALYHESVKIEDWEAEKCEEDMEKYTWIDCASAKHLFALIERFFEAENKPDWFANWISTNNAKSISDVKMDGLLSADEVKDYSDAITKLHNEEENDETLAAYKRSVRKLLGFDEKHFE